jgi:hypothetical protein
MATRVRDVLLLFRQLITILGYKWAEKKLHMLYCLVVNHYNYSLTLRKSKRSQGRIYAFATAEILVTFGR